MKFTGQSKDGVFENLLRAYVSRPSNPDKACTEFDPDQANAYIERRLTGSARSQYEHHLWECTGCRKNVVALMRLAQADVISTIPVRQVPQSTWFASILQSFSVLARPQWALAAAALLVLGISLPLIVSMNRNRQDIPAAAQQSVDAAPQASRTPADSPATLASARTEAKTDEQFRAHETTHRGNAADKSDAKPELIAKNTQPATGDAAGAAGLMAGRDLAKKQEAGAVAQEELRAKSESQLAQQQVAPAPAAPGTQGARSEAQQTRQQQPTDKESAQQIAEPKPRADQESNEKSKVSEAAVAAPPPSADAARDRAMKRPPSKLALRDPSTGEAVRVEERKTNGKHFFLRGGAWTDKDYDPDKDLPTVTVIRDSNVYKELLSKRSGLKTIMALFAANERAIIVFKGTVYKLIPQ
jgi:hypothetical protein